MSKGNGNLNGLSSGALVEVRGRRWVVSDVDGGRLRTLVELQSVEDGRYGETLDGDLGGRAGPPGPAGGSLPEVPAGGFDPPERLAAFLDAVRWSAVDLAPTSTHLQAPFRSGVAIEDYQLEPVARAVDAPRVNLLLADDVGLGKTIEAGLVAQELLLRHRARRVMVVCPAGLTAEVARRDGREVRPRLHDRRLRAVRRRCAVPTARRPTRSAVYPLTICQPALAAGDRRRSGCSTRCCRPTATAGTARRSTC